MSGRGSSRRWSERLAGSLVFPLWAMRDHPGFASFRRQIERSQYWPAERLQEWQQQRLIELLRHAAAVCPFYRRRFHEAGLDPERGMEQGEWQRLPLLTKRDIQIHGAQLEAADFPAADRLRNQTGGSTGSPLQFWVDRRRFATRMASTHRHNAWCGHQPGDRMAVLWGARLDAVSERGWRTRLREKLVDRMSGLNTSSISPEDWKRFLGELGRLRPRFLLAYARAAVAFADFVLEQGITDVRFEAIITSAEVLDAGQRRRIETALGGPVFNRYGAREVSVIASECNWHTGLHVNAEALLVEILPAEGLPAPWGKVVITDLLNRSMPLIRYEIGDVSRWQEGACACGRGLPRLAEVQGRTTDFLHLPDGRWVSGPALTLVVADMPTVRQVQFVQRGKAEIVLRVVPGSGYDETTRCELRRRLDLYVRGAMPLRLEEVSSIASEASGKYRFVVQEDVSAGAKA